jgi:UDP-glucose 4-epimerase
MSLAGAPPENMPSYLDSRASSSSASLASSALSSSTELSSLGDLESPLGDLTNNSLPGGNGGFVLVIGGLGYIGSHTTLELLKEGYNVIVVDDLSNSYQSTISSITKLTAEYCSSIGRAVPDLIFHELDYQSPSMRSILADYALPKQSLSRENQVQPPQSRISGVIHFAAHKAVEESIRSPLAYYQNNVCGLVDFIACLADFGIKNFVFSSSATVYGAKTNRGVPLREEDVVYRAETYVDDDGADALAVPGVAGLTSPYGRTKYFCEAILADVAHADPSWSIIALRYFNPVGCHESGMLGEDPRQRPTNLFPVIARVLTGANPSLDVFGSDWETHDGTAVRDFIHVVDLARGHIAALAAAKSGSIQDSFRAYNLGTGRGATVTEAVSAFEEVSGCAIPVRRVGRRAGDVGSCIASTARVERELVWTPERSLLDCARDTWGYICKSRESVPS